MFNKALVVGKFAPLHKGHDFLIREALLNSKQLMIINNGSDEVGVSSELMHQKIMKLYPTAISVNPKNPPANDASELIHRTFCWGVCSAMDFFPDVIFTSEDYGDGFAEFMSNATHKTVKHVCVDKSRAKYPISGTMIRNDPELYTWKM